MRALGTWKQQLTGLEVVDEATSPFALDSLPRPLRQLLFLRSLRGQRAGQNQHENT